MNVTYADNRFYIRKIKPFPHKLYKNYFWVKISVGCG